MCLLDVFLDLGLAICSERRLSPAQLVGKHPHTPYIDLLAVAVAIKHLRRDVVQRPAERHPFRGVAGGQPEIAELGHTIAKQDVLRLQIPVDDVVVVHLLESHTDIPDDLSCLLLTQVLVFLLLEVAEEVALIRQLRHQVDRRSIRKVAVELEDVGMVVAGMQLDLPLDLPLQTLFLKELLIHGLDGNIESCMKHDAT